MALNLYDYIRDVPDFPKEGIIFKDITPLLHSAEAFQQVVDEIVDQFKDEKIDCVAAAEARGFIIGAPIALKLGASFVPIRKPGKLPYKTRSYTYELEYGTDTLEVHTDAIQPGQRVLMVDDLLATGGTMEACCKMVEEMGGTIAGCAFVIELAFLKGREKLKPYKVVALLNYDAE